MLGRLRYNMPRELSAYDPVSHPACKRRRRSDYEILIVDNGSTSTAAEESDAILSASLNGWVVFDERFQTPGGDCHLDGAGLFVT